MIRLNMKDGTPIELPRGQMLDAASRESRHDQAVLSAKSEVAHPAEGESNQVMPKDPTSPDAMPLPRLGCGGPAQVGVCSPSHTMPGKSQMRENFSSVKHLLAADQRALSLQVQDPMPLMPTQV